MDFQAPPCQLFFDSFCGKHSRRERHLSANDLMLLTHSYSYKSLSKRRHLPIATKMKRALTKSLHSLRRRMVTGKGRAGHAMKLSVG
jgi:hypothetical protein